MNRLNDKALLASLGIEPDGLGPEGVAGVEAGTPDQGLAKEALLAGWLAIQSLSPFIDLRQHGSDPGRFRASTSDGTVLVARGPALGQDRLEGSSVEFRLPPGDPLFLVRADGRGILIQQEQDGLHYRARTPFPEFAQVRCDAGEWAEGMPWLEEQVRECLAPGGDWVHVAAAARVHRYAPVAMDRVQRQAAVTLLLSDSAPDDPPARWLSALSDAQVTTIRDLAMGTAMRVRDLLSGVSESREPDAPWWREDLRCACLERDDLQGLLSLAAAGQCGNDRKVLAEFRRDLEASLESLDEAGRSLMASLAEPVSLRDPRLERYAIGEREAWWLEPFRGNA